MVTLSWDILLNDAVADFTTEEKAMGAHTYCMRVKHGLLMGLCTAGACFVVTAPPTFSDERQLTLSGQTPPVSGTSGSYQPAEKPAAVSSAPGMTVYIDQRTGALLPGPTPDTVPLQLTPEIRNALSTSDQGLVEVPSLEPGGGFKVNLQGRFQSPLFAITDANGKVKIQHLHEIPVPDDKK
jgi:hypothetical protein